MKREENPLSLSLGFEASSGSNFCLLYVYFSIIFLFCFSFRAMHSTSAAEIVRNSLPRNVTFQSNGHSHSNHRALDVFIMCIGGGCFLCVESQPHTPADVMRMTKVLFTSNASKSVLRLATT